MSNPVICGGGLACERTCPVYRPGRLCPTLPEWLDELVQLDVLHGVSNELDVVDAK